MAREDEIMRWAATRLQQIVRGRRLRNSDEGKEKDGRHLPIWQIAIEINESLTLLGWNRPPYGQDVWVVLAHAPKPDPEAGKPQARTPSRGVLPVQ